jgi:hypothetical protein
MPLDPGPIDVSCKTQGELLEAVRMMTSVIDGFPDVLAEPSINACYQKASALIDQAEAEATGSPRANAFPTCLANDSTLVSCPVCAGENVHPESVAVLPCQKGRGMLQVDHNGTAIMPDAEPDGRGAKIWLRFHCENGHAWTQSLHFHKGSTTIETEIRAGEGDPYYHAATLWRD